MAAQINSFLESIILSVLAFSSVLLVLEATGLLPSKLASWLNRNRIAAVVEALQRAGITKPVEAASNGASQFLSEPEYKKTVAEKMATIQIRSSVAVGEIQSERFNSYVDLRGATVDLRSASYFARALSTHLAREKKLLTEDRQLRCDFVACPKNGAPILAYEFAKIFRKPLALHCNTEKFRSDDQNREVQIRSRFEIGWDNLPPDGSRALIVDDSTTGGRMVASLVSDLRQAGYLVEDCVVVFEPKGKGARERLKGLGVTLHSIVSGPATTG